MQNKTKETCTDTCETYKLVYCEEDRYFVRPEDGNDERCGVVWCVGFVGGLMWRVLG